LSRPELIKQLKLKNPKLNQSEIEIIIDNFCENIEKALKDSRKVELRGFGMFFVKKIKEKYSARNPKTGELIYVPEKNKVRFRASKNLKKKINE
jgi:nucleoid DNA-binding protein|tara:strand:+ start:14 stop:295 length:282 start_codon:yes stop_codon:yes gene_type:complete